MQIIEIRVFQLLIFICTAVFFSTNKTSGQSEFIIGTFVDPVLSTNTDITNKLLVKTDSISFQIAKDAYFNLLTGNQNDAIYSSEAHADYALYIASKVGLKYLIRDKRFIENAVFCSAAAAEVVKHYKGLDPARRNAFSGYNVIDEQRPADASNVKQWLSYFKKNDPGKLAYINLWPDFGFDSKDKYEKYLDEYLFDRDEANTPEVVCYDHYPFHPKDSRNYFYNLFIIRKKAGDKPFWCYPLSSMHLNYIDPDENYLRFRVFCPIAYGAKGIIYFTYEHVKQPDYKSEIVNNGVRGERYYIVKTINRYVTDIIAPVVMNSKNLGTFHKSNSCNPTGELLAEEQMLNAGTPLFADLFGHSLMAGVFKDNLSSTKYYGLVVNKSFIKIKNVKIILKGGDYGNKISVSPSVEGYDGVPSYSKPDSEEYNPRANETEIYINSLIGGEGRILKVIEVS